MSTHSKNYDDSNFNKNDEEKVCVYCNATFYSTDPDHDSIVSTCSEDFENNSSEKDEEDHNESSVILEKPTRYRTAYMIFTKYSWSQYRAAHPEMHFTSSTFQKMSITFAAQWKKMTETEKAPYRDASAAEKAIYEERMVAYKAQQLQLKYGKGASTFSKRPLTSYMRFAVEEREKVLQAMGGKSRVVNVARTLGRRWAALPEEVKEAYKAKAREAREKYDAARKDDEEGQENLESDIDDGSENVEEISTTEEESDIEAETDDVKSTCSSGFRRLRRGSFSPAYSFSYGESFGEDEEEDLDEEDENSY